jgi:2-polyprenyl-3-methyl-5-hydroxy-6-metoxy-1,4-benzoquinol methylase
MKPDTKNRLLKIVHDNYREIAAQFDVTRKKYIWPELEKVLSDLRDGDSVLDVGCGNGRLIENLKNKSVNYLGVDNSEELIKLAGINYPDKNFKVLDILKLETLNQKFDLVISVAVLHHLPSRDLRLQALEQFKSVTKPNGKIIFSVWRLWDNKKYQKYLWQNIWQKLTLRSDLEFGDLLFPWKNNKGEAVSVRYYHAFTKSGLKKLLHLSGFKNFKLYSDKHNYWIVIDTP